MDLFPVLYTNRLVLRKITSEDIPSLLKYGNNKKIAANVLNIPYPYQEPDAVFRIAYVSQGYKNKARYVFSIVVRESEEFIGEVSLHLDSQKNIAQLAYWLGEPFWNRGIATEATRAVVEFGFAKLNLDMIFGECLIENKASEKVMLNNGMKRAIVQGNVVQYAKQKEK